MIIQKLHVFITHAVEHFHGNNIEYVTGERSKDTIIKSKRRKRSTLKSTQHPDTGPVSLDDEFYRECKQNQRNKIQPYV